MGKARSDSRRGGGSPCPERFVPEEPECVERYEMALNVECVEDSGVNRQGLIQAI